jgi:CBS domain-containing protein
MKARDLMTRDAECLGVGQTLQDAAKRLADRDVGAMPICGDDDRLKGMLTDRDIVVKAVARGKDVARTLVGELAQGKPVTIGADDSVGEAVKTMERAQVRRLPVIDGHRLVGILSQADVALAASKRQAGDLLAGLSEPSRSRSRSRFGLPLLLAAVASVAAYLVWRRESSSTTPQAARPLDAQDPDAVRRSGNGVAASAAVR